jgi:hypothetical protein
MKVRRAVALGAVALATAACSGGVVVPPTTSGSTVTTSGPTSTVATARTGTITGFLSLAGGPPGACDPQHLCLQRATFSFTMGAYVRRIHSRGRFDVRLNPGVYEVAGTATGHRRPCETKRLVVKAGITSSVRLWCQIA